MKKCTGEVDDIDDIAKNVKIAMQKSHDKLGHANFKKETK